MGKKTRRQRNKARHKENKTIRFKRVTKLVRVDEHGNPLSPVPVGELPMAKKPTALAVEQANNQWSSPAQQQQARPDNVVSIHAKKKKEKAKAKKQKPADKQNTGNILASVQRKRRGSAQETQGRQPVITPKARDLTSGKGQSEFKQIKGLLAQEVKIIRDWGDPDRKTIDRSLSKAEDWVRQSDDRGHFGLTGELRYYDNRLKMQKSASKAGHAQPKTPKLAQGWVTAKSKAGNPYHEHTAKRRGLAPSGAKIKHFLEGGKYAPKKDEVKCLTPEPDGPPFERLPNKTENLVAHIMHHFEPHRWPDWLGKLSKYEGDTHLVNQSVLNNLTVDGENKLLRSLLGFAMNEVTAGYFDDTAKAHKQEIKDLRRTNSVLEYHLSMERGANFMNDIDLEKGASAQNALIQSLREDNRKLANALRDAKKTQDKASPPDSLEHFDEELAAFRELAVLEGEAKAFATVAYGAPAFGDAYDAWKDRRLSEQLRRMKQAAQRRVIPERKALRRIRKAVAASNDRKRIERLKHHGLKAQSSVCISRDVQLFEDWGKRPVSALKQVSWGETGTTHVFVRIPREEYRLWYQELPIGVKHLTSSSHEAIQRKLDKVHAEWRRWWQTKTFTEQQRYIDWWNDNYAEAVRRYSEQHTLSGKALKGALSFREKTISVLNTELNPAQRKRNKEAERYLASVKVKRDNQKREKQRKRREAEAFGRLAEVGAVAITRHVAKKERQAELDKLSERDRLRRAYGIAH